MLRGVQDYRNQGGKESHNQDVSHAARNLKDRLKTTGPMDAYDMVSERNIAHAEQFFYRRMAQDPNADPWRVMEEGEKIFGTVSEKRDQIKGTDKARLEDARMHGLAESKAISPAAHKAYRDKQQEQAGWNIVQEALKNLPPPPPPGFFERLRGLLPKGNAEKKTRKEPGVMGE